MSGVIDILLFTDPLRVGYESVCKIAQYILEAAYKPQLLASILSALPSISPSIPSASRMSYDLGSNTFGTGVYNSSQTPTQLAWDTYNYCNAPHVNSAHYSTPSPSSYLSSATFEPKLVYVNAMIRHHKRTPDNLYPNEAEINPGLGWDCSDIQLYNYVQGGAAVFSETVTPSWYPFRSQIWNGTCDKGQLTAAGFEDAIKHGEDFWSVYHSKLGFLETVNDADILIRTSTEPRTKQVAGGFLFGMDPRTVDTPWKIFTQPSIIDSIPPSYACPAADAIRDAYQSVPAWSDHLDAYSDLQARLDAILGTAGLSAWSSWYDHFFDTFTSRTCNGHPLPCNSTGACVFEEDARAVHAIGDFEYNYIWNNAENATEYLQLTFGASLRHALIHNHQRETTQFPQTGAFFAELAHNFNNFKSGSETHKLRFYVGHDGSMVRLAAGLGFGAVAPLRWPALGSEIVMEVWEVNDTSESESGERKEYFVRVLHEGTPVSTLEWKSLDDFIALIESNIPENLFEACLG